MFLFESGLIMMPGKDFHSLLNYDDFQMICSIYQCQTERGKNTY